MPAPLLCNRSDPPRLACAEAVLSIGVGHVEFTEAAPSIEEVLPLGIRSPIVVDLRPRRLKHIPSPQTAPSASRHSRGLGPLSSLAALASRASCSISYGLPPITSGAFEPVDDLRNVNSAKVSASGNRIPPPKESVNFPLSKA